MKGAGSMRELSEIPADIPVVWWGKAWEPSCTPELHVPIPEENLCHECYQQIRLRESGISVRAEAETWIHYHAECWADAQAEARQALRDRLEADLVEEDEMPR